MLPEEPVERDCTTQREVKEGHLTQQERVFQFLLLEEVEEAGL